MRMFLYRLYDSTDRRLLYVPMGLVTDSWWNIFSVKFSGPQMIYPLPALLSYILVHRLASECMCKIQDLNIIFVDCSATTKAP